MPIVVPYTKQVWIDNNGANPVSAARMGVLEEGILDVSQAPAVRVTHNASQTATTAVALVLAFNTERYDQAAGAVSTMHDTVTNNSRLTAIYAGIYLISIHLTWAANATGSRLVQLRVNGATTIAEVRGPAVAGGVSATSQSLTTVYSMAVNDYVEVLGLQDSGGNLTVIAFGNSTPEFMMVRVG
jgi:hypothetical protein